MSTGLDGRTAIVTGAGRGIGLGIAERRVTPGARTEVGDFFAHRAANTDTWLGGMNKLQRRLEDSRAL